MKCNNSIVWTMLKMNPSGKATRFSTESSAGFSFLSNPKEKTKKSPCYELPEAVFVKRRRCRCKHDKNVVFAVHTFGKTTNICLSTSKICPSDLSHDIVLTLLCRR
mmetsp:Transcript_8084/g.19576  ORF Transcript_8084/g.19576 Transcript_8084/m.19576 type:complete len:106 (+) Transcript_8084:416-733(+)